MAIASSTDAATSIAEPVSSLLPGPAPLRVLVVDDNVDGAQALCAVLSSMGWETAAAFGGAQGLAAAAAFDPHLALIDLEMPDMNGCDVARRLRAPPAESSAWLICLTGRSHPEDRRLCMQAGFDDFFVKPLRLESLVEWVAGAARPRRREAVNALR
jgi:CheY-like chemotaxis protein